ncbi:MAG: GIY-YIG nuclease family protein [Candidatus Omnitrophica bacterium]|nr:GIY-YIG nuclease family protein [Candidatus Omnitrophota bacterium]
MYYLYVLKNEETKKLYYGYTNNLERRIIEHNQKQKWEFVYYEAYKSEVDARNRERRIKHYAQALTALKGRLQNSLN